jgi:hypothetical protein
MVNVSDSPGKVHVTVTLFPDIEVFILVGSFNSAATKRIIKSIDK